MARRLMPLAMALAVATPAAFGQPVPADVLKVRLQGLVPASPRLNSVLGKEVGGKAAEQLAQKTIAAELTPERARAALDQARTLQQQVDSQLRKAVTLTAGSVLREGRALQEESTLAAASFLEARNQWEEGNRLKVFAQAGARNAAHLKNALLVELSKQSATSKAELAKLAKTDALRAVNQLINASPDLLKAKIDQLGTDAASLARGQMKSQLSAVLDEVDRLGPAAMANARAAIADEKNWQLLRQTSSVVTVLMKSQARAKDSKEYVAAYQSAVDEVHAVAEGAIARAAGLGPNQVLEKSALKATVAMGMQLIQGKNVSADEFMSALDKAGLKVPSKQALRTTLDRLGSLDKPKAVAEGLNDLQGYLSLAESVGVKIDPQVTKAVSQAQSAATIVTAALSGNYVAALSNVGALFGGGGGLGGGAFGAGGDPQAEARHAAVMKELGEIKELQVKTLKKLDDLSEQLAQTTQVIMSKLDGMQDSLQFLVDMELERNVDSPMSDCRGFYRSAVVEFKMVNGVFDSYAARTRHFNAREARFVSCSAYLAKSARFLSTGAGDTVSVTSALWNVVRVRNGRRTGAPLWAYDQQYYFPMVAYTNHLLNLHSSVDEKGVSFTYKPNCGTRFVGALAAAPAFLHDVHYARQACGSQDLPATSEGLSLLGDVAAGVYLPPDPLLDVPIHAALASEMARYALFLQSYRLFLVHDTTFNRWSLLPESSLATGPLNVHEDEERRRDMRGVVDVVNAAIAQQTLMSGIYVSSQTADILRANQFGLADAKPNAGAEMAKVVQQGCAPHLTLKSFEYETAICMLAWHPVFAQNVMLHLALQDLSRARVSLDEYAELFDKGRATRADVAMSFQSLHPYIQQHEQRWVLELRNAFMKDPLRLPLPSAAELKAGTVAYPEVMHGLLESRSMLLEELNFEPKNAAAGSAALWARSKEAAKLPRVPG